MSAPPVSIHIQPASLESILPVRQQVLRPGCTLEQSMFPQDKRNGARHWCARMSARAVNPDAPVIACLSLYPDRGESLPENTRLPPASTLWRLRGMAVLPPYQGQNIGAQLLRHAISHLVALNHNDNPLILWCNARTSAAGFYQRNGFAIIGDRFIIDGIGPHYPMGLVIKPAL